MCRSAVWAAQNGGSALHRKWWEHPHKERAMGIDTLNIIRSIIQPRQCTKARPREFYIAWNGVPTLAYCAFSRTLLDSCCCMGGSWDSDCSISSEIIVFV